MKCDCGCTSFIIIKRDNYSITECVSCKRIKTLYRRLQLDYFETRPWRFISLAQLHLVQSAAPSEVPHVSCINCFHV